MHIHALDERPRPAHSRSLSFYLALFLVVIPVYAVVPLSWTFFLVSLVSYLDLCELPWPTNILTRSLLAFSSAEILFSIWHFKLYLSVAGFASPLPVDIHVLNRSLTRVLQAGLVRLASEDQEKPAPQEHTSIFEPLSFDDPCAVDFRDRLRTWFRGVPWSHIRRTDVYAWLYWATYGLPFTGLQAVNEFHRAALQDALKLLEYRIGCEIPEGNNPAARPYRLRLDPISVFGRPLALYGFIAVGNRLFRRHLSKRYGAHEGRHGDIEYVLRIPEGWTPSSSSSSPILLLHGLGIGFLQYQTTITDLLLEFKDRPVLVLRQPSISQDIFHPKHLKPMPKATMVDGVTNLLESLGWTENGVTVVSHSNGSIPHAWLVKDMPAVVRRSCFIDPVVFCTWEGDVCHNFVYRRPDDAITLLMRYFIGTELGIANTIQRNFNWADNTLWFEEIPRGHKPTHTRFYLGGKDAIVASERVRRYLLEHGAHDGKGVVWSPTGRHGEAILTKTEQLQEIFDWLAEEPSMKE